MTATPGVTDDFEGRLPPFVSVIVPVYNDAERLLLCLTALEAQTYPATRYEVVVVDNGAERTLDAGLGYFPHARWEHEPRPGGSRARVTGIERARGEILAFTDADCLPEPTWIARGVASFLQTPQCGLVAGRIEMFAAGAAPATAAEIVSLATHMKQERLLREGRWAVCANLFTGRSVIEAIGAMNPAFIAAGEVEWGMRIHAAGYRQVYAPDATVRHPARASLLQLCRRALRLEFAWKQLRDVAGIGVGVRFWVGQHAARPLRDLYRDILCHPQLTAVQKLRGTVLSCLLIVIRILAWGLMLVGIRYDVRKNWG